MREQRRKIWIDRFQTRLAIRIALYFLLYQAAVWSLFVIWRSISADVDAAMGPVWAGYCFLLSAATIVFLGLLFIVDAVKTTHRLVGPLYRFRKTIQAITAGEEAEPALEGLDLAAILARPNVGP